VASLQGNFCIFLAGTLPRF